LAHFTICIPSNRPLKTSRASIESAIAFAAATGGHLVIADNSGDPEKALWLADCPAHVTYRRSDARSALENLISTFDDVTTEFMLLLGDDDLIELRAGPFDFASLPGDYVAVRPRIDLWTQAAGIVKSTCFALESDDVVIRMSDYLRLSDGDNATYYSFFRSSVYMEIFRLIARSHPTCGDYIDWTVVMAMAAAGKFASDGGTVVTYNIANWASSASILEQRKRLFYQAGLPEKAMDYEALLGFLDCYGLVTLIHADMSEKDRLAATYGAAILYLKEFLQQVDHNPDIYADASAFIDLMRQETMNPDTDPESLLPFVLAIIEQIAPGLCDAYLRFYAGEDRV
jgi:hypothetical protein